MLRSSDGPRLFALPLPHHKPFHQLLFTFSSMNPISLLAPCLPFKKKKKKPGPYLKITKRYFSNITVIIKVLYQLCWINYKNYVSPFILGHYRMLFSQNPYLNSTNSFWIIIPHFYFFENDLTPHIRILLKTDRKYLRTITTPVI